MITVKRLTLGRNNVTRVQVEPRLCDQGCRNNDAFAFSITLPTVNIVIVIKQNL